MFLVLGCVAVLALHLVIFKRLRRYGCTTLFLGVVWATDATLRLSRWILLFSRALDRFCLEWILERQSQHEERSGAWKAVYVEQPDIERRRLIALANDSDDA